MTSSLAVVPDVAAALPALIDRAASILINARGAAEVLEARDLASNVYDAAKKIARIAKAKGAHDTVVAAAHRAQADALEIEAGAKRRLADEYDAAQERGEIASITDGRRSSRAEDLKPTATDIGLTHKDVHEARIIRDAEAAEPGIVRRALDQVLAAREEPTKAKVKRAVLEAVRPQQSKPIPSRGREAIRERVLEAILILSGLPPAEEVVGYFAGTDATIIVSERLSRAAEWLANFNNEWNPTDAQ